MKRVLLLAACAGCFSSAGSWSVESGAGVAQTIKPLLTEGSVRHVVLLRRGHAYRVHHNALVPERKALVEALLSVEPDDKVLDVYVDVERQEPARPVVKLQYPGRVLSLGFHGGSSVRIVRLGGGGFEVWLSDRDGSNDRHRVYVISDAEAVDRAWDGFEDAALAQASETRISGRWWRHPPEVVLGYAEWYQPG